MQIGKNKILVMLFIWLRSSNTNPDDVYPVLLHYYATWTTLSPDRLLDRGLWENKNIIRMIRVGAKGSMFWNG